jgi:glyoxylase-like metal-dependent hydrolase (beta-lactamase superfamily II)
MQIRKGLFQIGGSLNGITWMGNYKSYEDANVYVLDSGGPLVLFDCGIGSTWPQIEENMRYWDLRPEDIKACFLTHAHMDHSGACAILAKSSIPLYAHKNAAEAIAAGDERCAGYLYHRTMTPCRDVTGLEDGQTIRVGETDISLAHFPGHTAGCAAYAFALGGETVIVSGDIIGTLLDGFFGWSGSFDFDKKAYLNSLIRFARTKCDIMLPGHGMIYFHDPRVRIEEALCQAFSQWR